jgi:hypothetical protein
MAVFSLGFVSAGSSLGFEKLKFENWRERERESEMAKEGKVKDFSSKLFTCRCFVG